MRIVRTSLVILAVSALALLACRPHVAATAPTDARFGMQAVVTPKGAQLVRFDSSNGDVWTAPLVGPLNWTQVGTTLRATEGPLVAGRFHFDFVQAKSTPLLFLRLDTLSGNAWRLSYPIEKRWLGFRPESGQPAPAGR